MNNHDIQITEVPPENLAPLPTDFAPARQSPAIETDEVSLERFRSGYTLVRTVMYIIAGVYVAGITYSVIMALVHQPSAMDIKEFSLEVIRLLIPPLTFILGFMFGAKEKK